MTQPQIRAAETNNNNEVSIDDLNDVTGGVFIPMPEPEPLPGFDLPPPERLD
jgi:hypothetical protein